MGGGGGWRFIRILKSLMADVRSKLFANYFLWNFGFISLFISFFSHTSF